MLLLIVGCGVDMQPALATVHIRDVPVQFSVEIARTAQQQRDGLSGRTHLADGTGMLFRFNQPQHQQVWMADMRFPLDVAWIAHDTVLATRTLQPCTTKDPNQCPRWTSPEPVDALLEAPADSLSAVRPGMSVTVTQP